MSGSAAADDFADLTKFGIDHAQIGQLMPDLQNGFAVWPEHWHAVQLFVAMGTQWRCAVGERLIYTGLDYSVLPIVERRLRFDHPDAIAVDRCERFAQLRVLEAAARAEKNEG